MSFHENRLVNGTVWEDLEKLKNGEVSKWVDMHSIVCFIIAFHYS